MICGKIQAPFCQFKEKRNSFPRWLFALQTVPLSSFFFYLAAYSPICFPSLLTEKPLNWLPRPLVTSSCRQGVIDHELFVSSDETASKSEKERECGRERWESEGEREGREREMWESEGRGRREREGGRGRESTPSLSPLLINCPNLLNTQLAAVLADVSIKLSLFYPQQTRLRTAEMAGKLADMIYNRAMCTRTASFLNIHTGFV